MSLITSTMVPLGNLAPDFELLDTNDNKFKSLKTLKGEKGTLVMFICNHCPFVVHLEKGLAQMAEDYKNSGIKIIAISANDADMYPSDGPAAMQRKGYPFPYLYDETQQTAVAYNAVCTPDFFLFDSELNGVYRGQFDDARPGRNTPVTGESIREAMDSLINGTPVNEQQKASIGCSIKWK